MHEVAPRATGATGPEERHSLDHNRHSGPSITSLFPLGDRAMAPHRAKVSPLTWRVLPTVQMSHHWKSLLLSRVVVRMLERCGYLAWSFSKRKFRRGTAGMSHVRRLARCA